MKKRLLSILVMLMTAVLFAGCGQKENTEEVKEAPAEASENIITVGDKGATEDEIMFYMLCIREQYEGYFGKEIWDVSFGTKTFLDMCKDDVLNEIVQLKVITSNLQFL